jgi:hypothetical protein
MHNLLTLPSLWLLEPCSLCPKADIATISERRQTPPIGNIARLVLTPQKGRKDPVRQRPLALVQQGLGEVVEGPLATMAPGAFAPGATSVRAPAANVVALAARTLQRTVFPPQQMDIGLALFGVEEVVQMGRAPAWLRIS